jgi:molecular chaperone Hsp33
MSQLHKFLFEGLPVRGALVQLTEVWQELLARRAQDPESGAYPPPVRQLLGEMTAAAVLMQSTIKFNGALILQIMGDGPVKLAVAEVQADLGLRATAKVIGPVQAQDTMTNLVNVGGQARCAITLDPRQRQPGQQPYQGVVSLNRDDQRPLTQLSDALAQYMWRSEQLDTTLVLAANDERAAGLLIQRMPSLGEGNLAQAGEAQAQDRLGHNEDYQRLAILAQSLKQEELLTLDADTVLRRLFWEESVRRFEPQYPRFQCSCGREKVGTMLRSLGLAEAQDILAEQGQVSVACDFCGQQYVFDAVDVGALFHPDGGGTAPASLQ